jgi:Flp pilus assembly protein TadG
MTRRRLFRTLPARLVAEEDGPSAVEFALISAILVPMILGLVDYGLAQFKKMELVGAVRSGAQYTLLKGYDSDTVETIIGDATNIDAADLTISSSEFCECLDDTSISACGDSCDDGDSNQKFVTITATYDFTPIILPNTITISESTTIRTE